MESRHKAMAVNISKKIKNPGGVMNYPSYAIHSKKDGKKGMIKRSLNNVMREVRAGYRGGDYHRELP